MREVKDTMSGWPWRFIERFTGGGKGTERYVIYRLDAGIYTYIGCTERLRWKTHLRELKTLTLANPYDPDSVFYQWARSLRLGNRITVLGMANTAEVLDVHTHHYERHLLHHDKCVVGQKPGTADLSLIEAGILRLPGRTIIADNKRRVWTDHRACARDLETHVSVIRGALETGRRVRGHKIRQTTSLTLKREYVKQKQSSRTELRESDQTGPAPRLPQGEDGPQGGPGRG